MSDFFEEAVQLADRLDKLGPEERKRIQWLMDEYWRLNPRFAESAWRIQSDSHAAQIGPYDWSAIPGGHPLPLASKPEQEVFTRTITFYGSLK